MWKRNWEEVYMNDVSIDKGDLIEKLRDHKFYLENFCKVKSKERGLVPFILNEAQKDFFNTLHKHKRIMILKSRQLGFSTATAGYFYVDTITNPGTNTGLVGYNAEMCSNLLDMIKTFHRTTPKQLRPKLQEDSKWAMSFPKIDSKIFVLPCTDNVGRGYTLHNCLATETSAWENAEERMAGLEQAVPKNGTLVNESTPRGIGNLYHRMWMTENEYVKKEYGWWWGYTKEFMATKLKSLGPRMFAQEYGLKFLESGRPVFDLDMVEKQRKNVLKVGDKNGEHTVTEKDGWRFYRPPEPDGIYVCGADVAQGVQGGDYSFAVIINRKTGEEVAMFRGMIAADVFGDKLNEIGRYYNNALMVVEINASGLTVVLRLKELMYPSLYFRPAKFETLGVTTTDKIGWRTTPVTRPLLIDELVKMIREGLITVHSKEILDEMTTFVFNDNNDMVPMHGFYDDGIFATGIALQGFKVLYSGSLTQLDESAYMPKHYSY